MGQIIVCECGTIVRGESEEQLVRSARGHMQANHPAVAEQITDEELMALSQDDGEARQDATT